VFVRQFYSPLVLLLLVAAVLAASIGHSLDAAVIGAVVLLNAGIGALQEGRAENALAALSDLAKLQVRVVRENRETLLEAQNLVPGDLLSLAAGDEVGADARVVECRGLETAEAALTGESEPVAKKDTPLPEATALTERCNMVFAGTLVTAGRAKAVVVATGGSTEIGRIAALTRGAPRTPTPLERRLQAFSRSLFRAAIGIFVLVTGFGMLRGIPFADIFLIALSEMVSMVPEGLPIAWTVALAVGSKRWARSM
jgi:Ca2+-transporting ATPase